MADLWTWLQHDLQSCLTDGMEVDTERIAVYGDSAGGYLAVQLGLTQPAGNIKAIIAAYPMVDLEADHYTKASEKSILGRPPLPSSLLSDYVTAMKPGAVVTAANPPDRFSLGLSIVQQGVWAKYLGTDDRIYPTRMAEKAEHMPFMFVIHGELDSAVPIAGSIKFAEQLEKKFGEGKVLLHIEAGAEHGCDLNKTLDTPWLKEGLDIVADLWLGTAKTR